MGEAGRAGTPVPTDSLEAPPGKQGPACRKQKLTVPRPRLGPACDTAAPQGSGSPGLTPLCSSWLLLACSIWELSATLVNFSLSTLCR